MDLVWACAENNIGLVTTLLENPELNLSFEENWALQFAAQENYIEIFNLLFNHPRLIVPLGGGKTVCVASTRGNIEILDRLLKWNKIDPENPSVQLNIDPSFDENIAIRMASTRGHLKVVNRLLEDPRVRINLHANENEAINKAYENKHIDIVNRLLDFKSVRSNFKTEKGKLIDGYPELANQILIKLPQELVDEILEYVAVY